MVPFHLDGPRDAADPVPFGPGAHVHEAGAGGEAEQVEGLGRQHGAGIGKTHGLAALLRQREDVGELSHGGTL